MATRAYILMRDAFDMNARPMIFASSRRLNGRAAWTLHPDDITALDRLMAEGYITGHKVKRRYGWGWEYRRIEK